MSEPFVGQILFSGLSYAPRNYAACDGQTLPINQYVALYSLLGTTYGGDGRTTFQLPDLRGRSPTGGFASADPGWNPTPRARGTREGVEAVQLTLPQLPTHSHAVAGTTTTGTASGPTAAIFAASGGSTVYTGTASSLVPLAGSPTAVAGGSGAHPNMQPYTVIAMAIALTGIYPPRP